MASRPRQRSAPEHGPESGLLPRKTFLDPVQGDVKLTACEIEIVNTAEFQRLGRIRQLGTAVQVYRGATHTRFDHALGTLATAERMVLAINNNPRRLESAENMRLFAGVPHEAHTVVRLCALLHDITHVPFGHTLEDEVGLFERHDEPARYARFVGAGTTIGEIVRRHHGEEIRRQVEGVLTTKPEQISVLGYPFAADIVGNTLCADLVDYLRRDAFFTGLEEPFRERFLEYLFITTEDLLALREGSKPSRDSGLLGRLVVRLNKKDQDDVRRDQVSDIVNLLRVRYRLAERVYYHHSKMKTGAMLGRAVLDSEFMNDRDALYEHGDDSLLLHLARLYSEPPKDLFADEKLNDLWSDEEVHLQAPARVARCVLDRRLYVPSFLVKEKRDATGTHALIKQRLLSTFRQPERYREWVHSIERDMGLRPGDVAFYCPSDKMQRKLAKALVAYGEDPNVMELGDVDDEDVRAEIGMIETLHRRLWRFYIYVHPDWSLRTRVNVARLFKQRWAREHPGLPIWNDLLEVEAEDQRLGQPETMQVLLDRFADEVSWVGEAAPTSEEHRVVCHDLRTRPPDKSWRDGRPTFRGYLDALRDIRGPRRV